MMIEKCIIIIEYRKEDANFMPVTLIQQKPDFTKVVDGLEKLSISEMFADTLQGEGVNTGVPATFIRLQGCTLQCVWCDTLDVWTKGNQYSYNEVFDMFESIGLIDRLKDGQHLIITGGSPLKQQHNVIEFIHRFIVKYGFKPYVEVENETVLIPNTSLIELVDCWNNSPKLGNSLMKEKARYKPEVISAMSGLNNSWFKFVVNTEAEWFEIKEMFVDTNLINKNQIILMPEGQNRAELEKTREFVADLAIRENVRFSDRQHIVLWDRMTGV